MAFRQTPNGVLPYVMTCVRRRSFIHYKVSGSNVLRIVRPRITKFDTNIQANLVFNYTGYDITNYFQSEVIVKKLSKMPQPTTLDQTSRERLKQGHEILQHYQG